MYPSVLNTEVSSFQRVGTEESQCISLASPVINLQWRPYTSASPPLLYLSHHSTAPLSAPPLHSSYICPTSPQLLYLPHLSITPISGPPLLYLPHLSYICLTSYTLAISVVNVCKRTESSLHSVQWETIKSVMVFL